MPAQPVSPAPSVAASICTSPRKPQGSFGTKIILISFVVTLLLALVGIGGAFVWKFMLNSDTGGNDNSSASIYKRTYYESTLSEYSPEEIAALGIVSLPAGFEVQEEYKGIKIVKSPKSSYTPLQVKIIKYLIDQAPKKFLDPGPAAVVTFQSDELELGFNTTIGTAAFASGPYLFFDDGSFDANGLMYDDSFDTVILTFNHELAHVAQFNAITDILTSDKIAKLQTEYKSWMDCAHESDLFSEFASVAGWEKSTTEWGTEEYSLTNPGNEKTTEYGKTSISEDMAEVLAHTIMRKEYVLSDDRVAWALSFLEADSLNEFSTGRLPTRADIVMVNLWGTAPYFDYEQEEAFDQKYDLTDMQSYGNDTSGGEEEILQFFKETLAKRGWTNITIREETIEDGGKKLMLEANSEKIDVYIEIVPSANITGYVASETGSTITILSGITF